jgi:hypothetical protein
MSAKLSPTRLLTIGAILTLLALSVGGALAERLEQRAAGDRLHFGDLSFSLDSGNDLALWA